MYKLVSSHQPSYFRLSGFPNENTDRTMTVLCRGRQYETKTVRSTKPTSPPAPFSIDENRSSYDRSLSGFDTRESTVKIENYFSKSVKKERR